MKKHISILLVENDEDDYVLLKSYLDDLENFDYSLEWVTDYMKGFELMKQSRHDVFIIDYLLGGKTGLELLEDAIKTGCEKPIIILTGKGGHNVDVRAMEFGAADFLIKSEINGEKLERSIRYSLERYETLNALKESEEKYRNIFESSRDMIYITDESGKFIEVNEGAHRIFGYTKEELLNLSASVLYENDEDRKSFLNSLKKTGVVSNYEVLLKHKSGEKRYCLISAAIQLTSDVHFNILGIVHDITRRRQIERNLMVAEKLAITGRVAQTLAHEIRNPLSSILLTLEQFSYELADNRFELYFDMIKRNCKHINNLLTELLYSSNPMEIQMNRHGLNKIIDDTIDLIKDRVTLKRIRVNREISDEIGEIALDEGKFKTALLNILINAVEAVSEYTGEIRVNTKKKDDKCYIEIEDNGVGIAKEHIGRLFEPYFTKKPGGVGLGLATTSKIIESHGGTIEVESEPQKGTKFAIVLNL